MPFCHLSRYLLIRCTCIDVELLRHITAEIVLHAAKMGCYNLNKLGIIQNNIKSHVIGLILAVKEKMEVMTLSRPFFPFAALVI